MKFIIAAYNEVIYRPLVNGLVLIYTLLPYPDLGLTVIILTVVVRLILHPALVQTLRSQRALASIAPRLREIQERFKDNKEEQSRRIMAIYRAQGIHPLSGCLPVLIQLPVLFGLYQVFWKGIVNFNSSWLYSFVPAIAAFNPVAFGLFDLTAKSRFLAVLAGVSQLVQARLMSQPAGGPNQKSGDLTRALQWQTTYFLPVMVVVISWTLPSAIAFYWTIFNILAIVQQAWIQRRLDHERHTPSSQPNPRENGHSGRS